MINAIAQFRKKYTLALLLWLAGSVLAFKSGATLVEYTMFTGTLLTIFGVADVAEKQVQK